MDQFNLSKKERIALKHEQEQQQRRRKRARGQMMKWGIIGVIVVLVGAGIWWFIQESNKPLPGKLFDDQGRDHVPQEQWQKFAYNSNPPTSGPHDPVWTKAGIYDSPQGDGHLVHSLEHGYIEMHYNCGEKVSKGGEVSHVSKGATESGQLATATAQLSDDFKSQDCKDLVKKLTDVANEKKLWKMIVVPRPNMDSRIALTAWRRLDKFNDFDKDRIVTFIDAFRNHGPEQTME